MFEYRIQQQQMSARSCAVCCDNCCGEPEGGSTCGLCCFTCCTPGLEYLCCDVCCGNCCGIPATYSKKQLPPGYPVRDKNGNYTVTPGAPVKTPNPYAQPYPQQQVYPPPPAQGAPYPPAQGAPYPPAAPYPPGTYYQQTAPMPQQYGPYDPNPAPGYVA